MDRKIIPLLIVLICSLCCLSLVSADSNNTDNLTVSEQNEELGNYIMPIAIGNNGIEFSDRFTGFCIDSSKAAINSNDKFTAENTNNDDLINHIKLAIIESYKAGKENNLGDIISHVINGDNGDDVVQAALKSTESIGDTAVVNIDNTTEATFTFELLKSADDSKSDCLAYKVSLKTIENNGVLSASNKDANGSESQANSSQDPSTESNNNQDVATKTNDTGNKAAGGSEDTGGNKSNDGQTIINETNTTIINKNNTLTINENNTTIINKNNVKTINETPKNATIQNSLMRATGNPLFILAIIIVIVAIVGVVIRRRN